jgi:SAM-dependent methyltransferase
MTATPLRQGEFGRLAEDYSRYRPGYSDSVLSCLLGLYDDRRIDVADIGAGTGIWTRMIARRGVASVVAIEPDDDMRRCGARDNDGLAIDWRKGDGEHTGLADASVDWVSMASSFHWLDTQRGLAEFARILRPGGWFVALWNPRKIEENPVLAEIEDYLRVLAPDLKRVSSGRSGVTQQLSATLKTAAGFDQSLYLESDHTVHLTKEQYVGAWRSVNDIQAQLGAALFERFLDHVNEKIEGLPSIEATYTTRAWAARRTVR